MKTTLALIVLLASIWLPALSDQYYPIEGWLKEPITYTFVTLYVLMFFVLVLKFSRSVKG